MASKLAFSTNETQISPALTFYVVKIMHLHLLNQLLCGHLQGIVGQQLAPLPHIMSLQIFEIYVKGERVEKSLIEGFPLSC